MVVKTSHPTTTTPVTVVLDHHHNNYSIITLMKVLYIIHQDLLYSKGIIVQHRLLKIKRTQERKKNIEGRINKHISMIKIATQNRTNINDTPTLWSALTFQNQKLRWLLYLNNFLLRNSIQPAEANIESTRAILWVSESLKPNQTKVGQYWNLPPT